MPASQDDLYLQTKNMGFLFGLFLAIENIQFFILSIPKFLNGVQTMFAGAGTCVASATLAFFPAKSSTIVHHGEPSRVRCW
jgi:hypothetical protein